MQCCVRIRSQGSPLEARCRRNLALPRGGGFEIRPGRGGCTPGFRRQMCWIDPDVAVGYDYCVSDGDPKMAAIQIPAPLANGDEWFELEFEGHQARLHTGERYDFTSLVPERGNSFRVSSIDVAEGLDPENPTAFVSGLLFMDGGADDFSVTMRPLVVAVPEPSAAILFGAGLLLLSRRLTQGCLRSVRGVRLGNSINPSVMDSPYCCRLQSVPRQGLLRCVGVVRPKEIARLQ